MSVARTLLPALLLPAALAAQARTTAPSNDALSPRLDSIVRAALATSPVAGMSVGVVRGRDTLLHRAYGLADLGLEAPATLRTTSRLVFPMAAIGIMQQVERGRLRLDDDASRLLPELDWQGRRITVRQLLDATSGIPDYHYLGDPQKVQRSQPQAPLDVAALFMGRPFVHEPGAAWSWTISGFHLAGMLLERVSGQPYGDYLRQHVLAPAGLRHTFYCPDIAVTPGLATGYEYASGGRFVLAHPHAPSHYAFLMTVCTNAADAASLVRALRDGRLLRPESYRTMTTAVGAAQRGDGGQRGVGVRIDQEEGHRWVGERGALMGYNTSLLDFPDDSLTVVVLQNTIRPRSVTGSRLARELARATLGLAPLPRPSFPPEEPVPAAAPLAAGERARYHGTYRLKWSAGAAPLANWASTPRVYDEAGVLMIHVPGQVPEALLAEGEHRFRVANDHEIRFTFTMREGRAVALTMSHPSATLTGPRADEPSSAPPPRR